MHYHIHSLTCFRNRRDVPNVTYLQFDFESFDVFPFAQTQVVQNTHAIAARGELGKQVDADKTATTRNEVLFHSRFPVSSLFSIAAKLRRRFAS